MIRDEQSPSASRNPDLIVLADGAATEGRLAMLAVTIARGDEPPRHRHHREDETIYVLAGALRIRIEERSVAVPVGAAAFLPRGVEHGFIVTSAFARLLITLTPAGFEDYYRELHGVASPTLEYLVTTAARYGCEITGPSLTEEALASG
jgi:quercetin dioxygenase-like cupin family protein